MTSRTCRGTQASWPQCAPHTGRVHQGYWRTTAAARALADLDGLEVPALRIRFEELLKGDAPTTTYADRLWILYALGLSRSADAERFLNTLRENAEAGQKVGVELDDIRFALSLKATAQ
jgi:hypothetical protein